MDTTAVQHLTYAHQEIYSLASKASDYLAEYEGTSAVLTYGDIASGIAINMTKLGKLDGYVVYLAIEAACDFRGWTNVAPKGEPSKFTKKPVTRNKPLWKP